MTSENANIASDQQNDHDQTNWGHLWTAMRRGMSGSCPACGHGMLYKSYSKINDACDSCGRDLERHRADDAPAYFTIFIVGHIIIPLVLIAERQFSLDTWLHAIIWIPLTLALTLMILPWTKGALVGLQLYFGICADGTRLPKGNIEFDQNRTP